MIAIIQSFPISPPKNGGTKFSFRFCEELNLQTEMICVSTTNNDTDYAPFQIIPLFSDAKTKYLYPHIGTAVIDKCVEKGVTTIILNHPYMAPLIFRKAKKMGLQVILYAHNIEYQRFRSMGKIWWPALYLVEKWSFSYADYVLFVSDDDMKEAERVFPAQSSKFISAPFCLVQNQAPQNRTEVRMRVRSEMNLSQGTKLLYFYGPMDYLPNREALKLLILKVLPILEKENISFVLALSGKGLPPDLELLIHKNKNIKWLGFVDDFESQLQATDIMLNPIWLGGGVKVKLMEALGNSVTAISFESGALGLDKGTVADKLHIIPDQDCQLFARKICQLTQSDIEKPTPEVYYQKYAGKNVIKRVIKTLGM